MKFAKCEDERHLLNHAFEWQKYIYLYYNYLKSDEATLRIFFVSILPNAITYKFIYKWNPTWRQLMHYIYGKMKSKRKLWLPKVSTKRKD